MEKHQQNLWNQKKYWLTGRFQFLQLVHYKMRKLQGNSRKKFYKLHNWEKLGYEIILAWNILK